MPAFDLLQVVTGASLALVAAGLGYIGRALSHSGAVAAFFLGTLIFGLGGLPWALLLLTFFVPSSLLSLMFKKRKALTDANYEKGSRRDAWQVLANGGLAGFFAVIHWMAPGSLLPWLAASASLAAASADTWATELGALSRREPVLITTGRKVARGTSGAVSLEGEMAALLGAAWIAAASFILFPNGGVGANSMSHLWSAVGIAVAGLLGCTIDSALGATLQVKFFCPLCSKETEKHPTHGCGTATEYLHGIRWLNNDWVNFACTLSAVVAIYVMSLLI